MTVNVLRILRTLVYNVQYSCRISKNIRCKDQMLYYFVDEQLLN